MPTNFKAGHVVLRHWTDQEGLSEISQSFKSIDELFNICLQNNPSLLVDRVVLEGHDMDESPRIVTLVFQSVSMKDQDAGR
jgi:hypothetical protein